jgi:dolichol-phosphate mannosyltransferase
MKTVVVVPTYNEKANIASILNGILSHKHIHVLVVDDSSPDGTAEIVRKHMKTSNRVQLLLGEKQGLGVAYKRGFEYAIAEMDADILIEMDADGSHDPKDIPRLLQPLLDGQADFVIGSRYVKGGSITGWSPIRYLTSWGGNLVARLIGGILSVRDCTAGFRAMRTEVALRVDWDNFASHGYSFQIRLLYQALNDGARVVEIPVVFRDRELGKSKLGIKDIIEFFFTAVELGFHTYRRVIVFLVVGLLGLFVNEGVFVAAYGQLTSSFLISQLLGITAGIISNFTLHETWTFRDRQFGARISRFGKYVATSIVGIGITLVVGNMLYTQEIFSAEIAHLIAIGAATFSNLVLSFFWAWKD